MKEIPLKPLNRGLVALVDDEDYERLAPHKWFARWDPSGKAFYAQRTIYLGNARNTTMQMHREVMGLSIGDKRRIDHREPEETLNNQKYNLRFCTHGQNRANSVVNKNNKSGVKGVRKHGDKWVAIIRVNKCGIYLGTFDAREEAGKAYRAAAAKYHGEFARSA